MSAASSGVARGMTPGSLKLVLNSVAITNMNNSTPTSGIANVISLARYTQLKVKKIFSNQFYKIGRIQIKFCLDSLKHKQESHMGLWHSCQPDSHPSELNYSQMVHSPKSNHPDFQLPNSPKSSRPDFQTCNVRFTESDRISTARQLC